MKELYAKYKEMIDKAIFVSPGRENLRIGKTFEDVEDEIRNDVIYCLKRIEVAKMAISYMKSVKSQKALDYVTDKVFDKNIEEIISAKIKESESKNDG